jgi:ABC-type polysaccharide transport system permease subunit
MKLMRDTNILTLTLYMYSYYEIYKGKSCLFSWKSEQTLSGSDWGGMEGFVLLIKDKYLFQVLLSKITFIHHTTDIKYFKNNYSLMWNGREKDGYF